MQSFLPLAPVLMFVVFVVAVIVLALGVFNQEKRKIVILYGFFVLLFLLGAWREMGVTHFTPKYFDSLVDKIVTLEGIVSDEPVQKEKTEELMITPKTINGAVLEHANPILLIARKYPEYHYGDAVEIQGVLKKPENFSEDFDYVNYLSRSGIYYFMRYPRVSLRAEHKGSKFFEILLAIKSAFSRNVNLAIPEPESSFMAGLILGERRAMPQVVLNELSVTGTTHIVALSGYNITIVGDSLMKSLNFFWIPFGASFYIAVLGILLFTIATGASASVVRAAIMGILVLVARNESRLYQIKNALVFAGAVMIWQNPMILRFDVSFQLSFLAALGLVFVSPRIDRSVEKLKSRIQDRFQKKGSERVPLDYEKIKKQKKSMVREIAVATLSAQFMVLPILVLNFGKLSLISPIANLFVLPFIPATMFLGFVTGIAGFFSGTLALVFGFVSSLFLRYELWVIHVASGVPFASIAFPNISWIFAFLFYGGVVWLLWRGKTKNF